MLLASRVLDAVDRNISYPCFLATSSTPRAILGKNGLVMSGTTRPTVRVLLVARLRATPLGL
jgi:hypothetical protein